MYKLLASGNKLEIARNTRSLIQRDFVTAIIFEYLKLLEESKKTSKLAFDFNDASVLVWAEIEDDDEGMETMLLVAEAKINAQFQNCGFCMSSTIVEKGDDLSIPNHYKVFIE